MRRKAKGFRSIKENQGLHKRKNITGKMNLGQLMRKHPGLRDYLFSLVTNSDWVFDDMDFSIEEFSDISGADLEEMLEEINRIAKGY